MVGAINMHGKNRTCEYDIGDKHGIDISTRHVNVTWETGWIPGRSKTPLPGGT